MAAPLPRPAAAGGPAALRRRPTAAPRAVASIPSRARMHVPLVGGGVRAGGAPPPAGSLLRGRRAAAAAARAALPPAASAAAPSPSTARAPPPSSDPPALSSLDLASLDAAAAAAAASSRARTARLELLVAVRRLYRNLLRADLLLAAPGPAYAPPSQAAAAAAAAQGGAPPPPASSSSSSGGAPQAAGSAAPALDDVAAAAAVEFVAELQLTEAQLRAGWRALLASYGDRLNDAFIPPAGEAPASAGGEGASPDPSSPPQAPGASAPPAAPATTPARDVLAARIGDITDALAARAADELPVLPFPSLEAAQAAVDARNRQFAPAPGPRTRGGGPAVAQRLSAAEKAVEAFFMRRLQPAVRAVRDTPPGGWLDGARLTADAARGLWVRLNGGRPGGGNGGSAAVAAKRGLPPLVGTRSSRAARVASLGAQVASLERQLQDASKAREARLRKAPTAARARLAGELRALDDAVASLARCLAVRTLQLEMEAVLGTLEEEALDVAQGSSDAGFLIFRQGSSDELTLLAAEAGLLDEQLAVIAAALPSDGGNGKGADAAPAAPAAATAPPPLPATPASPDPGPALAAVAAASSAPTADDALDVLAQEIPDLRRRLGIGDDVVFGGAGVGGGGLSLARARAALSDSAAKLVEGALFFSRGIRLLGTDVQAACGLFARAAAGASLKPREVAALRRTARDLATFVPFTIILVTPITPVGHVLVFGFLQRYFPGFFPSQFTSRRQELMIRYEELRAELAAAQEAATAEAEAAELAAAAEAVRRLTAPKASGGGGGGGDGGGGGAGAAAAAAAAGATTPAKASHGGDGKAPALAAPARTRPPDAALASLESAVAAAREATGTSDSDGDRDSDEDRNDARRA